MEGLIRNFTAFKTDPLEQPSRPRRRQRVNIPQEDTDDASWEGAPVTNAMNTATESMQETAAVEKVWRARALTH